MTKTIISIKTESPMLLSSGPPIHNLIETLEFIPGNTLRGLLAWQYIHTMGSSEDSRFQDLFMSGNVKFGFANIKGAQVIPLSARSCKYHCGFKSDMNHGAVDLVLADGREIRCPHKATELADQNCDHPIDYFEGIYDPASSKKVEVLKRLITRSAIDPIRGSAASQKLYSQRVIAEKQTFYASIEAPENLSKIIEEMTCIPFSAVIGKGRSRGQGWVTVCREEQRDIELPVTDPATERYCFFKDQIGKPLLVVTLMSDAIFHDDFLRDCTAPTAFHLETLGIDPDQWEISPSRGFADSRKVYGFDGQPLCLPRMPSLAVRAGSVFVFEAKDGNKAIKLPTGDGIGWVGDGNSEGFGRAILWHPFHIQYKPHDKE